MASSRNPGDALRFGLAHIELAGPPLPFVPEREPADGHSAPDRAIRLVPLGSPGT